MNVKFGSSTPNVTLISALVDLVQHVAPIGRKPPNQV